jgi:hypothetical protein
MLDFVCLFVFVWFSRGVSYLEGIIISRKSMTHSQLDTHLRCAGNYTNKEQLVSESLIWWERHFIFINLLDSLQSYTKGVKMISCLSKFLGDFFLSAPLSLHANQSSCEICRWIIVGCIFQAQDSAPCYWINEPLFLSCRVHDIREIS